MSASTDSLEITPAGSPDFSLSMPGSKSLSNRALLTAALADGESRLSGLLDAEDTRVMIAALRQLGFRVETSGDVTVVNGLGGAIPGAGAEIADIDVRLSGTTLRFLLPVLATASGNFRLHGTARMHERPVADQLEALTALGVDVRSEQENGCPPVIMRAAGLAGGRTTVRGDRSSQYLSGLLLAAPNSRNGLEIHVEGELQSKPFIDVTLGVMAAFGADVGRDGYRSFRVPPQRYGARDYLIEGDATAAGNFWVAAAITGGRVRVENVGSASLQGDRALAGILALMGCRVEWTATTCTVEGPEAGGLSGGTFDLNDIPDQALPLAVAGLFTSEPLRLVNMSNLRIKETDRIAALATELRRIGAGVAEGPDWLEISPGGPYRPAEIETYGDHRMAMAFALAGLRLPGIVIRDPGCVAKTYPGYFADFERMRATGVAAA